MCYFNYLEERGYLSRTDKYLYGMLLETVQQEFDEPVLIYLEMLKIFFPAGQAIPSLATHEEYSQ